jgi:predicted DNA binding CopG/RHH family protein
MKKRLPTLKSDAEAETFVATVDLTEYDLSAMVPVRFTLNPGTVPLSVDLPKHVVDEARTKATDSGVPLQNFIQTAIARAVLE